MNNIQGRDRGITQEKSRRRNIFRARAEEEQGCSRNIIQKLIAEIIAYVPVISTRGWSASEKDTEWKLASDGT